jgi:hypothetical protein
VPLFGRRKRSRVTDAVARPAGLSAEPPGWDGEPRGEPGIHGIARARRWDAVVSASAPALEGDRLDFVTLADGTILADGEARGEAPGEAVRPLADAVEAVLDAPFRAEARRQGEAVWAVGASSIVVLEQAGLEGQEVELVVTRAGRALHVDGRPSFAPAAALERAGEREGAEYVVRARRLAGELWEVEATAL